jgi:alginate O-acetyltransferase complex protein AlgI
LASLIFYAYGEPVYVMLLVASAFANYIFGLIVSKNGFIKKAGLVVAVIANLLLLCLFKYTGFVADTFGIKIIRKTLFYDIALPIGISFFTFQALSYVIDVYRGVVSKQTNFFKLLLYISFFPQLIAGPIVKYKDVENQLSVRKPDVLNISAGIQRFIFGLGKKVLLANTFAVVADNIFSASISEINIFGAWIGAVAYMFQIFFDFSGYSDMAIGMASMFGFNFMENFKDPYLALGIQDFWRRWHISLSTWFKEYLYIPLGGNRKSEIRTDINKIIVFLCTGIWHGANITFLFWGLYNGLFLLLESHVKKIKELNKWLLHIYTFLVVCVGFVFFR